jgi:hypothetical protein
MLTYDTGFTCKACKGTRYFDRHVQRLCKLIPGSHQSPQYSNWRSTSFRTSSFSRVWCRHIFQCLHRTGRALTVSLRNSSRAAFLSPLKNFDIGQIRRTLLNNPAHFRATHVWFALPLAQTKKPSDCRTCVEWYECSRSSGNSPARGLPGRRRAQALSEALEEVVGNGTNLASDSSQPRCDEPHVSRL